MIAFVGHPVFFCCDSASVSYISSSPPQGFFEAALLGACFCSCCGSAVAVSRMLLLVAQYGASAVGFWAPLSVQLLCDRVAVLPLVRRKAAAVSLTATSSQMQCSQSRIRGPGLVLQRPIHGPIEVHINPEE